ncbi:MAG: hypothetical protein JWP44_764 [Mucilaginibacter sp.]|nr:hypothetical protein [Mucilaginibacter sp.]
MAVRQPIFKPYNQQQILAIPPALEELIPQAHPVRVVNGVINKLNIKCLPRMRDMARRKITHC